MEHQLNSWRFPVFPGAISNSRSFPGFQGAAVTATYVAVVHVDDGDTLRGDGQVYVFARVRQVRLHGKELVNSRTLQHPARLTT